MHQTIQGGRTSSVVGRNLPLAVGAFAVGTDGFVVAGILPSIARDLGVSVGAAGQLVTVFALTYAVLSPVIAAFVASWDRRTLLLAGLAVLTLGNIATAIAPNFGIATASRVIAGVGAAAYTPTASATAASLAPPEQRGRALAVVLAGLSGATALGAPFGTLLGGASGWRATLWFVAGIAVVAGIAIRMSMSAVPAPPALGLGRRLAPARDPRVALTLAATVLVLTGAFTVYTYIAESLDRATGGEASVLAALLVVWGVTATLGNLVGGAVSDNLGTRWAILGGLALLAADFALLPWTSASLAGAVVALSVWGVCGWGFLVPQQHRLVTAAGDAAPLAIALNAAAIYLAVALSGVIGALGISAVGAHELGLISAVLIIGGLLAAEAAARVHP
jgi:DHA1 family inner membrane transport protein